MRARRFRRSVYRVSPHERLTHLRSVPFFENMAMPELVPFAEYAEEVSHRRGAQLVRRSEPVDAFHVLVEGEAVMRRKGRPVRRVGAGTPLGLLALLARDEHDTEVVAVTRSLTLSLDAEVFFDLLEARFGAFLHVLRATARQLNREHRALGVREPVARRFGTVELAEGEPRAVVDRFLSLRQSVPFANAGLYGLWHLARRSRTECFEPGETIVAEGEPSTSTVLITTGSVRVTCESDGEIATLGPRNLIGAIDLLAHEPRSCTAIADARCWGIVVEREELYDIFEDHFELASGCLAVVARLVLDTMEARAMREDVVPSGLERVS